ncbi:hypothetical protein [Diaphorobacter caeni]|uniref:hypothetical protein n=1 Tax=Diaphorobacter caeni TaxID=2784387 RepID=UPI00188DF1BE|nr:hypothetical protein [Diaphorobacter caeni]MBF5003067.1 hypothetical protein [Diaphorobacter caeni]
MKVRTHPLLALLWLGLVSIAWAQPVQPPSGFVIVGHIERFTLDQPSSRTSAATLRVRGVDVRLPQNLVITMPGGYLTAQQIFKGRNLRSTIDPNRSGLALQDLRTAELACPGTPEFAGRQCPLPPAEVEVMGNLLNGVYLAGSVRISQGAFHLGGGFIRSFAADGSMVVGAEPGTGSDAASARIKLNDPEGIYGRAQTTQDQRFAVDPGNSPVHARTGFPVCVPRSANDALCPSSNRPAGAAVKRFTCGSVPVQGGTAGIGAVALPGCRPHLPAPLRVGDFVNYVGRIDKDAQGYFISLHGLDAELGIYTSPGVDPAYVFIEEALEGTVGERYADLPQEETSRFKLIGFTSDPSRSVSVDIFDDDVDSNALPPTAAPARLATRLVPTTGAQLGRFKMIWSAKEDARVVRRAVRVTLSPGFSGGANHAPGTSSVDLGLPGASRRGGYAFGSYESPISEYLGPEATAFGVKGYQPPVPFENFCFLRRVNQVESMEPHPTNASQWIQIDAQPLTPSPAARAQSQATSSGQRVCGD